jgi:hypothetical protein
LFGAFGLQHLADGLLQVKMLEAWLAFIQLLLQELFSFFSQLSVQDTFQQLKAFAYITALQFPLSGC